MLGISRAGLTVGGPTIVGIDLHPVGPSTDLVPRRTDQIVMPVGLLGSLRQMPFWRTLWVVAARRDQSGARHEHSGPRHNTLVYGLLEPNVRVSGPFTTEVADRSYAGHERGTRMYRGAGDAFAVGLEKYLVRLGRLVVRVEQ